MPPHHATCWTLRTFGVLAQKSGYKVEVQQGWHYSGYWVEAKFTGR
jgi:hypothetical protein